MISATTEITALREAIALHEEAEEQRTEFIENYLRSVKWKSSTCRYHAVFDHPFKGNGKEDRIKVKADTFEECIQEGELAVEDARKAWIDAHAAKN